MDPFHGADPCVYYYIRIASAYWHPDPTTKYSNKNIPFSNLTTSLKLLLDLDLVQELEIDPRPDQERNRQKNGEDKPILTQCCIGRKVKRNEEKDQR